MVAGMADDEWMKTMSGAAPWTQDGARRVVEAWERSGETMKDFAARYGLRGERIGWWRSRLETAPEERVTLVPVTVRETPAVSVAGASVAMSIDGLRIEVAHAAPAWCAAFIDELRRRS